ncbi:MAG: ferritin family protein [Candidatus Eiseniibacteriota bacterium]|jgi:bacterioferritin (cytochrome b1)
MNLDEAIRMAISYEARVHKTYLDAMQQATDEAGKRFFQTLCEEEMSHLEYLRARLDEWQATGKVSVARLGTSIPARDAVEAGIERLRQKVAEAPDARLRAEIELLKQALAAEVETSNFYKEMVATLDADGRRLFERFVEIEEGHLAIVQAELDLVTGSGVWFDMKEINLEMG